MYCKNCGNEVNEKAIGCPQCGTDPRKGKSFCPSCASPTQENQVICVRCGISLAGSRTVFDASAFEKIDFAAIAKKKSIIAAAIALVGCFMPWVKVNAFLIVSLNFFQLSRVAEMAPGSILVGFILYLFPLALLGYILSEFVEPLAQYRKHFSIASIALLAYAFIGLMMATISTSSNMDGFGVTSRMMQDMISLGFGLYVTAIATIASFIFYKKES